MKHIFLFLLSLVVFQATAQTIVDPSEFPTLSSPTMNNWAIYTREDKVNRKVLPAAIRALMLPIVRQPADITYTPAPTGNPNDKGSFVKTPLGRIYFIDGLGNSIQTNFPYAAATIADNDVHAGVMCVPVGGWYRLSNANTLGMPPGTLRQRVFGTLTPCTNTANPISPGQTRVVGGAGILKVNGDPDTNPYVKAQEQYYESSVAFDTLTRQIYTYNSAGAVGNRWNVFVGAGIDTRLDTAYISSDTLRLVIYDIVGDSILKTIKVPVVANVTLTAGTGIGITGSSPSFTITNTAPLTVGDKGDITVNSLTSFTIDANTIDSTRLRANSVQSSDIRDGQVWLADLASNAVDSTKIKNNSIGTGEIRDGTILFQDWAQNGASTGYVPKWNGSAWVPAHDDNSGGGGGIDSTLALIGGGYVGKDINDNVYKNGTFGVGSSDTTGRITVRPIQSTKPGVYYILDGAGTRLYARVKNPSHGWNLAGKNDWYESAINGGASANGSGNFAPGMVTDTLPNVVYRRGLDFSVYPSMYESDETNWWGSGFLGSNVTAPRNVYEKHWQVVDSAGVEHRPLTGYFEKRAGGYGSLGLNVSLFDVKGWNYGQDAIVCVNRNSETRYGQINVFNDSIYTMNLSNLQQNSVLHLSAANKIGAGDPTGRANFLTIGGNGAFNNVIGIGALYTNSNNGGDLDAVFTTQTSSSQVEALRIKGGTQYVGVRQSTPLQPLDVNGATLHRGALRVNMVGDSAALVLKYASSQTSPIFKLQTNGGTDLAYFHVYNPASNPSLIFGRNATVNATSPNNTVLGLGTATVTFVAGAGNNTLIGFNTGGASYNGYENTHIGSGSGRNSTDGFQNTMIGYLAGANITTGYQNMFLGRQAGLSCTTGQTNVAIGANALSTGTTGLAGNVAIGSQAGQTTNGTTNVFIGASSGRLNTGSNNVFIGAASGELTTSVSNTFMLDNSNTSTPLFKGNFSDDTVRVFGRLFSGLSSLSNTDRLFTIQNNIGVTNFYRTSTSPEGTVTARPGDICYAGNGTTGLLYVKATGTGNTGWKQVAVSTDIPSLDGNGIYGGSGSTPSGGSIVTVTNSNPLIFTSTESSGNQVRFNLTQGSGVQYNNNSGTQLNRTYSTSSAFVNESATRQQTIQGLTSVNLIASDGVKTALFTVRDSGYVTLPTFTNFPAVTGDNKTGWNSTLKKIQYMESSNIKTVANKEDDFKGLAFTIRTSNFTLGATNIYSEIVDANAGSVVVTLGVDMEEGKDFVVKCRRNGTNTVTFSAGGSHVFEVDGSSSIAPTSLVVGGTGIGIEAPYKVYTIRRSGLNIFIQ